MNAVVLKSALVAVFVFVSLQGYAADIITAGSLKADCVEAVTLENNNNAAGFGAPRLGFCGGYMLGFLEGTDGMLLNRHGQLYRIHRESGITPGQMERTFLKYMGDHPQLENTPASAAVLGSLLDSKLVTLKLYNH